MSRQIGKLIKTLDLKSGTEIPETPTHKGCTPLAMNGHMPPASMLADDMLRLYRDHGEVKRDDLLDLGWQPHQLEALKEQATALAMEAQNGYDC